MKNINHIQRKLLTVNGYSAKIYKCELEDSRKIIFHNIENNNRLIFIKGKGEFKNEVNRNS